MTALLKLLPIAGIALFCLFMGTGQLLFKLAAVKAKGAPTLYEMLRSIALSPWFWSAGVLYAVASLLWVVILTRVPLSIAYPASALTIVLVPIAGWMFFGEHLDIRFAIGMAAMLLGIWLIASR
ncbi:MAG: hypothetical protein ABIR05_02650 [Luteimonas sp.]